MKISIGAQIEEVDREIALRKRVYPNQVSRKNMRQSEADLHIERMGAVKTTLEWLRDNEADIRAAVAARKEAAGC